MCLCSILLAILERLAVLFLRVLLSRFRQMILVCPALFLRSRMLMARQLAVRLPLLKECLFCLPFCGIPRLWAVLSGFVRLQILSLACGLIPVRKSYPPLALLL